ncbi:MAG: PIN domain-containing protein [Proteobacteria bacterium]|nr:PIN domain-containing protein [Pseudomonadota bacterium]
MIHLDANVAIALLNDRQPQVRARFDMARAAGTPLALSIIVFHELMYGAAASERRKANEDKIAIFITSARLILLPFEAEDAREAAEIRADLKRAGAPIGPYDVLIAAQARRAGTTLVTANTREFERVPGLTVVDWSA